MCVLWGIPYLFIRIAVTDLDPLHVAFGRTALGVGTAALATLDKAQTNGNDGRAFAGNFLFSTGPNTDAGGTRDTRCHFDIPMRHCSVSVDGKPMTVDGKVVAEGQIPL